MDIVIGANHKQKCDNPKCLQKESRIKSSALYSTAPQPVYSRLGKSHVCICVAGVVVSTSGEGSPRSKSFCVFRQAPLVSDGIHIFCIFYHLLKQLKCFVNLTTKVQIRPGLLQRCGIKMHFRITTTSQKQNKALN